MNPFRTNEYTSIDIFNYVMFFANLGFAVSFLPDIRYIGSVFHELIYRTCNYYKFALPLFIFLLLYYFLSERKIKQNIIINSNLQKFITKSNIIIFTLIMLCYIVKLYIILIFSHSINM